jgi:hypothetical protein
VRRVAVAAQVLEERLRQDLGTLVVVEWNLHGISPGCVEAASHIH